MKENHRVWGIVSAVKKHQTVLKIVLTVLVVIGFFFLEKYIPTIWQAITAMGTVAIPIVFYILGQQEQRRQQDERKATELRQQVEDLLLSVFPNLSVKELVQLSSTQYRLELVEFVLKWDLAITDIPQEYHYLHEYITYCIAFLQELMGPGQTREFYRELYADVIINIKGDLKKYIRQQHLNPNWKDQYNAYNQRIAKRTKKEI